MDIGCLFEWCFPEICELEWTSNIGKKINTLFVALDQSFVHFCTRNFALYLRHEKESMLADLLYT